TLVSIKDVQPQSNSAINDAMLGLISLGYKKSKILPLLQQISSELGANITANDLIIHALRNLK
ncbi:MAG: hypothetical protein IJS10_01985, partial [Alphaproteobacteria bacterium]|nr:hypothetical protein [Alphaproteobacteria bacterium]